MMSNTAPASALDYSDGVLGSETAFSKYAVLSSSLPPERLAERLEITNGACCPERLSAITSPFEQGALVPRDDWRAVGTNDLAFLSTHVRAETWRTLNLLSVPSAIVSRLMRVNEDIVQKNAVGPKEFSLDYNDLVVKLDDVIAEWADIECFGPLLGMVRATQPGGAYASTSQTKDGNLKTGLHIDSWDHKDWSRRRGCSNRISINIGSFPRHLVFCPVTVDEIFECFGESDQRSEPGVDLTTWFLSSFLDVPLVRMRVMPGEAYLAPTENLIHDGSTLLVEGIDDQIVLRGHFRARL